MHWIKLKDGSFINLELTSVAYRAGTGKHLLLYGTEQSEGQHLRQVSDKDDIQKIEEHLEELSKVSESLVRQIKDGKMWM